MLQSTMEIIKEHGHKICQIYKRNFVFGTDAWLKKQAFTLTMDRIQSPRDHSFPKPRRLANAVLITL